ncbi:hypothetical protein DZF91_16185 [Actinomadura logoneensis]|uniref:Uncharacterized protein n=1 Tax=Actinomadura logoneensis TaxID=2293572 RepID=A0A372JKS3_9ACTN|nr:hypothetical protein [Actinomadura logoneensis]RFU40631.1 hypothetical protein DZF91_16185 [Actinomadura logoneensis]
MRRVLVGVLALAALATLGIGHAARSPLSSACAGEPHDGSRLSKVVDTVSDTLQMSPRNAYCRQPERGWVSRPAPESGHNAPA